MISIPEVNYQDVQLSLKNCASVRVNVNAEEVFVDNVNSLASQDEDNSTPSNSEAEAEVTFKDRAESEPISETLFVKKREYNICTYCGKMFDNSTKLAKHKYHVHAHNNMRLFPCSMCSASFNHNFDLKKHIARKHSGSNFKCHTCQKLFKTNYTLKRHQVQKCC